MSSMLATRMPRVYIAGPFRSKPDPQNQWRQHQNIERANARCFEAWQVGGAGLCPHTNTRNFQGALPDTIFLQGDLAWLEVADAVLVTEDWAQSEGAREEVRLALAWGIPVFAHLGPLCAWMDRTPLTFEQPMPAPGVPKIGEVVHSQILSGRLGQHVEGALLT